MSRIDQETWIKGLRPPAIAAQDLWHSLDRYEVRLLENSTQVKGSGGQA